MKAISLSILLLSLLTISCIHQKEDTIYSADPNTKLMIINLDKAERIDCLHFSSILDSPKTLILETNDECLIHSIHQMEEYCGKLYILDTYENRLFVFNKEDGSFLYRIGKAGIGPGEYLELSDFSIDRKNDVIYLWDEALNKIHKYDLESREYQSSIKIDKDGKCSFDFLYKDGYFYTNETFYERSESNYILKQINLNTAVKEKAYLKSNQYNKGWHLSLKQSHSSFYSKNMKSPKYVSMFMDTIVSISDGKIIPTFAIQSNHFIQEKDVNKLMDDYYKNSGTYNFSDLHKSDKIYNISRYADLGEYVSFQYYQGADRKYVLYNIKNQKTKISNLFINDYIYKNNYIPMDFCYNDEDGVYTYLRSEFIPYFLENIIYPKLLNPNIDKYEQLIRLDEDSNPILFYHEYK